MRIFLTPLQCMFASALVETTSQLNLDVQVDDTAVDTQPVEACLAELIAVCNEGTGTGTAVPP